MFAGVTMFIRTRLPLLFRTLQLSDVFIFHVLLYFMENTYTKYGFSGMTAVLIDT